MSAAIAIARAVTLCIKHGITPDRLAELIAERQQAAQRPRAPRAARVSPRQDAIRAYLLTVAAHGAKVSDVAAAINVYPQGARGQLQVMVGKGTACMALGADNVARYFPDHAAAAAWLQTPEAQAVPPMRKALPRKPRPIPAPKGPTKRDQILALAAQAPDAGITYSDVMKLLGCSDNAAQAHLCSMAGHALWRGKVRGNVTRWFTSSAAADAWTQRTAEVVRSASAEAAPVTVEPTVLAGPVITPEGVPVTRVPAPVGRYEVAANAPLTGGFSSCRPGINPLTGRAWA